VAAGVVVVATGVAGMVELGVPAAAGAAGAGAAGAAEPGAWALVVLTCALP
jgi:hypothetical protein